MEFLLKISNYYQLNEKNTDSGGIFTRKHLLLTEILVVFIPLG